MGTDVDRQIERAEELLDRARARTSTGSSKRNRQRREAEVVRRIARIAIVDGAILLAAMVIGWFVPLGLFGALLVMGLLIAATLILAIAPSAPEPTVEALAQVPLKALPLQTEQWLEKQRPALPAPARSLVDAIGVKLETLSTQLASLNEAEPAAAEVRKLVGEQLPELIKGYGRVPPQLRTVERNGRTPDQQLVDGLNLIDEEVGYMSAQLAEGDLDLFATRGRYLQIRYRDDEISG